MRVCVSARARAWRSTRGAGRSWITHVCVVLRLIDLDNTAGQVPPSLIEIWCSESHRLIAVPLTSLLPSSTMMLATNPNEEGVMAAHF